MAILNIRGTSGSGKSHLIREVMARYGAREPYRIEGRKQPLGYMCHRQQHGKPLFVMGHYETACGGCDTITQGYNYIYGFIRNTIEQGYDVIYEGLIMQNEMARAVQLHTDYPGQFTVILLNTPLAECIQSVVARRQERADKRGKEPAPFNPANTEGSFKSTLNQRPRFKDAGVDFRHLSREDALRDVLSILGL